MNIKWKSISNAIEFYERHGYQYMDSPWYVSEDIINMTKPNIDILDYKLSANGKYLVASGEQSFLYLIMKGYIAPGKYCTVTPCFRFEDQDWLHRKTFMKCELIDFSFDAQQDMTPNLNTMLHSAKEFMGCFDVDCMIELSNPGPLDIIQPTDITINNIEVGSYGIRRYKNLITWVYGTGVAEPRLNVALHSV